MADVIDCESNGLTKFSIKEALDEYTRLSGRKSIIYKRAEWWNTNIGVAGWETEHDLWVAHYDTSDPDIPQAWIPVGCKFHQDSKTAGWAGFDDPTMDRDWFNGDENALREYVGQEPEPTLEEIVADHERRITILEGRVP